MSPGVVPVPDGANFTGGGGGGVCLHEHGVKLGMKIWVKWKMARGGLGVYSVASTSVLHSLNKSPGSYSKQKRAVKRHRLVNQKLKK